MTTYLTWRLVFAGEVVVVLAILAVVRWVQDAAAERRPRLDVLGAVLSGGLALVVLGVLQGGTWGWLRPRNSPFTIFGFAATLYVIGAGAVLLYLLVQWEHRREEHGQDPLIRLQPFRVLPLRAGLSTLLGQNTVLLGAFFAIRLYLQVVQGFNAFQTGLRLLPVSITMFVAATLGPVLGRFASPRRIVRVGLLVILLALVWLLATVQPEIDDLAFGSAMALLGVGMGLMASQLGNVTQSSVSETDRSEVGGLQYTAQNLGSALWVDPHRRAGRGADQFHQRRPTHLGCHQRSGGPPSGDRGELRPDLAGRRRHGPDIGSAGGGAGPGGGLRGSPAHRAQGGAAGSRRNRARQPRLHDASAERASRPPE